MKGYCGWVARALTTGAEGPKFKTQLEHWITLSVHPPVNGYPTIFRAGKRKRSDTPHSSSKVTSPMTINGHGWDNLYLSAYTAIKKRHFSYLCSPKRSLNMYTTCSDFCWSSIDHGENSNLGISSTSDGNSIAMRSLYSSSLHWLWYDSTSNATLYFCSDLRILSYNCKIITQNLRCCPWTYLQGNVLGNIKWERAECETRCLLYWKLCKRSCPSDVIMPERSLIGVTVKEDTWTSKQCIISVGCEQQSLLKSLPLDGEFAILRYALILRYAINS